VIHIYNIVKRLLDFLLSTIGIIILAPLYLILSLAVYLDDPGPVFFTQKRVGKYKNGQITYFNIYKFRTMKVSTPKDVPTHLLENPAQYITKIGKIMRVASLDELPQIFNIWIGQMSIIGPRPALYNQDDLISIREELGANDVVPGLTGWAQINGRDELEIEQKARYDGEYAVILKKGGFGAFAMDIKCFFGTFIAVLRADGVSKEENKDKDKDEQVV